MDLIIEFLGTHGFPTSFVGGAIFFIFLYHKQQALAKEGLIQDYQRLSQENQKLREELDSKETENRDLNEKLWKAEAQVEVFKLKEELTKE